MVKSLRESKARLSELVEAASRGEDVLITVRGKIKARLTRATVECPRGAGSAWVRELRALQRRYCVAEPATRIEDLLAQTRQDRP